MDREVYVFVLVLIVAVIGAAIGWLGWVQPIGGAAISSTLLWAASWGARRYG
jgi:uncharacterized membrane protein